ncbi:MAG TPA: TonB family protein [Pyrinomonadaceae bacterium]|nr:TonB family protein [Pyrinomonadaceae bacterium]
MRSKMLGLAIALSTFGVGVAATTFWISRHNPQPRETVTRETRYVLVAEPTAVSVGADEATPCEAARSNTAVFYGKPLVAGVLNSKAVSKPQPAYPPAARAALVSGEVLVEIMVDECGNVVMAKALNGHPLLRQAAIDAAMKTRFSPTLLSGLPVRIKGTMAFNFALQ